MKEENVSYIDYSQKHCDIVESGIGFIISYFETNDDNEKRSLLFCLDRYLDPYYKYNLSYEEDIFNWLETEFYKTQNQKTKEDIFQLLEDYSNIELPEYEATEDNEVKYKKWWQFWK